MKIKRRECEIEKKFVAVCRRYGGTCVKLGYDGWPDQLVVWSGGVSTYAELKRPGEEPEPHQAERIAELEAKGHVVRVVRNEADMADFISASLQRVLRP